jgi:hypothetical protein
MSYVEMVIAGKVAMVPEQFVKQVTKKQVLMARAMALQTVVREGGPSASVASKELHDLVDKIIVLNSKIPPYIRFDPVL